jgi:hypothetical protein
VYWNGTAGLVGDERHGYSMSWRDHEYLHMTRGTSYSNGLLGAFSIVTVNISSGAVYDEDIKLSVNAQNSSTVLYRSGASWQWNYNATQFYPKIGVDLAYDNAGTLTVLGASDYVAIWFFATNDKDQPIVALTGQRTDGTLANARANNVYENLVLTNLPSKEYKLLYRVLLRNSATPAYVEAQDYRSSGGSGAAFTSIDHGTLTGLLNDDHTQYLLVNGSRSMTGNLTFTLSNGVDYTKILNAPWANPGTCAAGTVVQNTTTAGVQCITPPAGAGDGYLTNVTVLGTTTKTITINDSGPHSITTTFTDIAGGTECASVSCSLNAATTLNAVAILTANTVHAGDVTGTYGALKLANATVGWLNMSTFTIPVGIIWNGNAIADAYISSATAWNAKYGVGSYASFAAVNVTAGLLNASAGFAAGNLTITEDAENITLKAFKNMSYGDQSDPVFWVTTDDRLIVKKASTYEANLNVTAVGSCVYIPGGGRLCGNTTCSTLYSPNGLTVMESCN